MRGYFFTLLGSVVVSFAACNVYDPTLYLGVGGPSNTAGKGGAGGGSETGGSGGNESGGSGGGNAYCGAPARAIYPPPPEPGAVPPSTKKVEIVAAQYTIDLGDAPKNPSNPPRHYLEVGFDLDNTCTTATNVTRGTCKLAPYGLGVADGPGGIDSALGALIQTVRDQIGNFSSDNYSKGIQDGKSNVLLRLQDWNGEANDDQVTVSTMVAAPFDSFTPGIKPAWEGNDAWPVASDAVIGDVEHPKFVDPNGYVTNNQMVATLSAANLRLNVALTNVQDVKLDMKLTTAFIVCTIVPETTGKWGYTFSKCTLGGRWEANDLVKQLGRFPDPLNNNKPLCGGTNQYETFKEGICSQTDVYHDPTGGPTLLCDSLSMGVSYTTKPALLGNLFNLRPIDDPCKDKPAAQNPKNDCCESIGTPDGGLFDKCGTSPGTGGAGGGGTGGAGTGGAGTGGRANTGGTSATGGAPNGGAGDAGDAGGTDGGAKDASPDN